MDSEKNLQLLIELINKIMPALVIIIAAFAVYFFFNEEMLKQFINLLVPILLYAFALMFSFYYRGRKERRLIAESGSPEMIIKINYFTFFWHDALIFCTPAAILFLAFWIKGEVTFTDILYSAVAMTGLYLSALLYQRHVV